MEFAVAVRRRTGEPGRERALGEEERAASVLAGGLDDDLRGPGVMVLAFSGAANTITGSMWGTLRRGFRFRLVARAFGPSLQTLALDEEGLSAWTLGSCLLLGLKQESCARRANHV
jgi:hypothetical protein